MRGNELSQLVGIFLRVVHAFDQDVLDQRSEAGGFLEASHNGQQLLELPQRGILLRASFSKSSGRFKGFPVCDFES